MSTPTIVSIDCAKQIDDLRHIWNSIGFDEINWSYTERGRDLLQTLKSMRNYLDMFLMLKIHFHSR